MPRSSSRPRTKANLPLGLDRPGDPGTVGWLAAGSEARLVDPDSGHDVPPGQPGELWVRGPQVMDGYFDDPPPPPRRSPPTAGCGPATW